MRILTLSHSDAQHSSWRDETSKVFMWFYSLKYPGNSGQYSEKTVLGIVVRNNVGRIPPV